MTDQSAKFMDDVMEILCGKDEYNAHKLNAICAKLERIDNHLAMLSGTQYTHGDILQALDDALKGNEAEVESIFESISIIRKRIAYLEELNGINRTSYLDRKELKGTHSRRN